MSGSPPSSSPSTPNTVSSSDSSTSSMMAATESVVGGQGPININSLVGLTTPISSSHSSLENSIDGSSGSGASPSSSSIQSPSSKSPPSKSPVLESKQRIVSDIDMMSKDEPFINRHSPQMTTTMMVISTNSMDDIISQPSTTNKQLSQQQLDMIDDEGNQSINPQTQSILNNDMVDEITNKSIRSGIIGKRNERHMKQHLQQPIEKDSKMVVGDEDQDSMIMSPDMDIDYPNRPTSKHSIHSRVGFTPDKNVDNSEDDRNIIPTLPNGISSLNNQLNNRSNGRNNRSSNHHNHHNQNNHHHHNHHLNQSRARQINSNLHYHPYNSRKEILTINDEEFDIKVEEEDYIKYDLEYDLVQPYNSESLKSSDQGVLLFYRKVLSILIGLKSRNILFDDQQGYFDNMIFLLLDEDYRPIYNKQDSAFDKDFKRSSKKMVSESNHGGESIDHSNGTFHPPLGIFSKFRLGYMTKEKSSHIYRIPLFTNHITQIINQAHTFSTIVDEEVHNSPAEMKQTVYRNNWYWHFLNVSIETFKCQKCLFPNKGLINQSNNGVGVQVLPAQQQQQQQQQHMINFGSQSAPPSQQSIQSSPYSQQQQQQQQKQSSQSSNSSSSTSTTYYNKKPSSTNSVNGSQSSQSPISSQTSNSNSNNRPLSPNHIDYIQSRGDNVNGNVIYKSHNYNNNGVSNFRNNQQQQSQSQPQQVSYPKPNHQYNNSNGNGNNNIYPQQQSYNPKQLDQIQTMLSKQQQEIQQIRVDMQDLQQIRIDLQALQKTLNEFIKQSLNSSPPQQQQPSYHHNSNGTSQMMHKLNYQLMQQQQQIQPHQQQQPQQREIRPKPQNTQAPLPSVPISVPKRDQLTIVQNSNGGNGMRSSPSSSQHHQLTNYMDEEPEQIGDLSDISFQLSQQSSNSSQQQLNHHIDHNRHLSSPPPQQQHLVIQHNMQTGRSNSIGYNNNNNNHVNNTPTRSLQPTDISYSSSPPPSPGGDETNSSSPLRPLSPNHLNHSNNSTPLPNIQIISSPSKQRSLSTSSYNTINNCSTISNGLIKSTGNLIMNGGGSRIEPICGEIVINAPRTQPHSVSKFTNGSFTQFTANSSISTTSSSSPSRLSVIDGVMTGTGSISDIVGPYVDQDPHNILLNNPDLGASDQAKLKERWRKKISNFKDTLLSTLNEDQFQKRREEYYTLVNNFNDYYQNRSPATRLIKIDDDFPLSSEQVQHYLQTHNLSSKKRDSKKKRQ